MHKPISSSTHELLRTKTGRCRIIRTLQILLHSVGVGQDYLYLENSHMCPYFYGHSINVVGLNYTFYIRKERNNSFLYTVLL